MNRNKIIENFLESDSTHLLFVEDENGKIRCLESTAKKEVN